MPVPRFVAKSNRYWINPVTRRFAGKLPPFLLIRHVGRTSGKPYQTPVWAFRHGDGFVIVLTYGPDTDWAKNLQAAGSCEAVYRGTIHTLAEPRFARGEPNEQPLPPVVQLALTIFGVRDFLYVAAQPREE